MVAKPLTLFAKILKAITTFSAVVGAAAVIWGVSVYFTKKDFSVSNLSEKVQTVLTNQQEDKIVRDSILLKINNLKQLEIKVNSIQKSQDNLTFAMQRFISNNKLATKEDLRNFVEDTKKNSIYLNQQMPLIQYPMPIPLDITSK